MARRTISSAQGRAINDGFLDLIGDDRGLYEPVTLDAIATSLAYVGAVYAEKLKKEMVVKDVDSSGQGSDSIKSRDVKIMGQVYSVEIEANDYLKFVNDGVDGWANPRGGKYQFKTKGVDPNGEMVRSIKAWLIREKKISRVRLRPVSNRESKRARITDANTKAAISAAYMIKRQGIKPTKFWEAATAQMDKIIQDEFSAALQVDIIENITRK